MTADDLTPGTPRPARASETITTASKLDALPVGSVVLDGDRDAWQREASSWVSAMSSGSWMDSDRLIGWHGPVTVLFRPDAPQPSATGNSAFPVADDAVERAARAVVRVMGANGFVMPPESARPVARAALAAAGEVDPEYPWPLSQGAYDALLNDVQGRVFTDGEGNDVGTMRPVYAVLAVTLALTAVRDSLATRGGAATPTEVEWGVRYPSGNVDVKAEDAARAIAARYADVPNGGAPVLMQRTVSAWREVS